ncbi:MAG: fibrobacter succinogenes major paralogous domain-containing protein [Muribaculaceae bacterium]|nr:fibrobacter succinogenes major paralogous domain-containing protein [Muribaculaceae bacterium]
MKKYLFSAAMMLSAAALMAQSTTPSKLQINLKDGTSVNYPITEIENITFSSENPDPTPEITAVKFTIPTSFSSSYVQKVMAGGKQIAEIDLEYIQATKQQYTVVYPCDENGKAILTEGITTTGASVKWDLDKNTATVGEEGEAITEFYIVDGELLTAYAEETIAGTVTPDLLVDVRGSETNSYRIVKIGTQYWMAENLRTTRYADGSAIDGYTETQIDEWKANTTGCYLDYGEKEWVAMVGYLYSGYTVFNEKGMAPEGWAIPTQAECSAAKTAGGNVMSNFKASGEMTWATGGEGNNITGFDAIATGYYTSGTGLSSLNTEAWFWTSTKYYDSMYRSDVADYMRITATGKNVVVSSSMLGGHSLPFGHSIRCIRK